MILVSLAVVSPTDRSPETSLNQSLKVEVPFRHPLVSPVNFICMFSNHLTTPPHTDHIPAIKPLI